MANLVDTSFFVGDINIANTSKPEVAQSVNLFISKYENELLIQILGIDLYDQMKANPTEERFQKLINGDKDFNWRGLVYTYNGSETKYSLIAYYVYWWWVKDKYIWNSGVGTIRPKPSEGEIMSPALKMMESWNTFSDQAYELTTYIRLNSDVYYEWTPYCLSDFEKVNDFDI